MQTHVKKKRVLHVSDYLNSYCCCMDLFLIFYHAYYFLEHAVVLNDVHVLWVEKLIRVKIYVNKSERAQKWKQTGRGRGLFFRVFYFGSQLNTTASSSNSGSKQLNTPSVHVWTGQHLFVYADKTYSGLFSVPLRICLQWPIDFTKLKLVEAQQPVKDACPSMAEESQSHPTPTALNLFPLLFKYRQESQISGTHDKND